MKAFEKICAYFNPRWARFPYDVFRKKIVRIRTDQMQEKEEIVKAVDCTPKAVNLFYDFLFQILSRTLPEERWPSSKSRGGRCSDSSWVINC
jgi:hypothetical protein